MPARVGAKATGSFAMAEVMKGLCIVSSCRWQNCADVRRPIAGIMSVARFVEVGCAGFKVKPEMAPQNFLSAATGIDKHRRRDFGASSAHEVCIHTSAHCNTRADLVIACSVLHCHISVLLLFVAYRPQYRSWIPQWASLANEGSLNNAAFGALFLPHSHITAARRCIEVSKTAVLQAIWRDAGGETGAGRSWRRNWLLRRSDGASALHDTTKGVRAGTTDSDWPRPL